MDTREQAPLFSSLSPFPFITEVFFEKLSVGDYAVEYSDGYRPKISFERKSIPDVYGTLGKNHARFKKEVLRAKEGGITLIVIIEGTLGKTLKGYKHSTMSGVSIVRQLFTLWVKYNIVPVFCSDRREMETYIYNYFCAIGRLKGTRAKQTLQDNPGRGHTKALRE